MSNRKRKAIAWAAVLLCVLAPHALAAPASREARVRQIAAMLRDEPAGFGRPIGDREAWARLAADADYAGTVRRAERLVNRPLPAVTEELYLEFSRTGERRGWERVTWERRGRIAPLVLAECLEDRGRFLPAFEALVRALCEERTWVMPAHDAGLNDFYGRAVTIDLGSSALAWQLATADYVLGERLDPEVRALLRQNVRRRVLDPYLAMVRGERERMWWMGTTNNWNAVCLAGVTGAALALVEAPEERAVFVEAAERYSRNFLRGFTPDGYCSEGLGYWNYGFGHYLMLAEAVLQATDGGVDLLDRRKVRAVAQFAARLEILDGVYPAFADSPLRPEPDARVLYYVSRRLRLGLRDYDGLDVVSPSGSLPEALMYSFANSASRTPPAEAAAGVGMRDWFQQAGVLICRPAEGVAGRFGVALKGGHNDEHHNHNDVGSYVVAVGRRAVLLDPGGEVYTRRTFSGRRYESDLLNSYGHPVPIVEGQLQRTGRAARAQVLSAEFTDQADTLVLDLTAAYNTLFMDRLERTFVYSRAGGGSLMVTDEVQFQSPQRFGTALITMGEWERLGPATLRVQDADAAVRVEIETDSAPFELRAEELDEDTPTGRKPIRIGIDLEQPVAHGVIRLKIIPMDGMQAQARPRAEK